MDDFSAESSRQSEFEKIQTEYNNLQQEKNNLIHQQTILQAKIDLSLEQQGQGNLVWLNKRQQEIKSQIENLEKQNKELKESLSQEESSLKNKQEKLKAINQRIENVRQELNQMQKTSSLPFEQEKELEEIFNKQQTLVNQLLKIEKLEELNQVKNQAREISQKLSLYLEKLKTFKKEESSSLLNLQQQLESLSQEKNDLVMTVNQITLTLGLKKEKIETQEQQIQNLQSDLEKNYKEIELADFKPKNKKEKDQKIQKELAEIAEQIKELEGKIEKQAAKIREFNLAEQNKKEKLIDLQKDFQNKQTQLNKLSMEINQFNIEITRFQTKKENLETDIRHDRLDLEKIRKQQNEKTIDEDNAYQKIDQLKRQLEIIGGIDEETQNEYQEIKERYDFLSSQSKDLEEAIKSLEKVIEELDKTIKEQFDKAFKEINKEFQKYFKILFNGGQSELIKVSAQEVKKEAKEEKEDGEEEGEEEGVLAQADKFAKRIKEKEKESYSGIEIKAVPPGKKITSISMLSGGERALTSIALICAIIFNNPSPFIVLDEVDAPLDEANSERFNSILQELAKKTQFITITHNRVTMHFAHVLYGITMGDDGVSSLLSIKLDDAEEMVGQT